MNHETDLLARQTRRRRIQGVILWLPWLAFAVGLSLWWWSVRN